MTIVKDYSSDLIYMAGTCARVSLNTEHDIFFEYMPHIHGVSIGAHVGGYTETSNRVYMGLIIHFTESTIDEFDSWIQDLMDGNLENKKAEDLI